MVLTTAVWQAPYFWPAAYLLPSARIDCARIVDTLVGLYGRGDSVRF